MQSRQLNILKAAMPYAALRFRKPMQIIIQAQELSDYMSGSAVAPGDGGSDMEAYELKDEDAGETGGNIEGLIENIRPYCTSDEISMFNTILGYIRTRNMLRSYMGFMASGAGSTMMDFMMSRLTPEQRSMYERMSTMYNAAYPDEEC